MQRLALLVAAAYATDSNYTTIVYTATGAQPNYATGFLESQYSFVGLSAELSHHEFEEPDEFTLWLGPQGTTTAEDLLNKTYDCDFRWDVENALETQGMLAQVSLTHACITVELGVGCDEGHALPVICPTNRTTAGHTDLGAGAIVAGQHHERFDGGGYPRGLSGEAIHLYGRITAIVDVFDALGAKRCYKDPWPLERIVAHFEREAGAQFDPDLTRLFLDNLERFLEIGRRYPDAVKPASRARAAA